MMNPLYSDNRLRLGTFCTNTQNMLTTAPDVPPTSWANSLAAARAADRAGFEAITPIARWKGYVDGKADHPSNQIIEAFTFAAAVAQATSHCAIFATSHAPTVHPGIIAKQCATIDHISGGRFALNVVGGWNRREFEMFGINLLPHDERYAYLSEWVMLLKRFWSGEEFDYESSYFRIKGGICRPVPVQQNIPIMNAASSPVGMRFAAQNADIAFCMPKGEDPRTWKDEVDSYRAMAAEFGREIRVWTNASVMQGATQEAAEALRRRYVVDHVDTDAVDSMLATMVRENDWAPDDARIPHIRQRISGGAGLTLTGTADRIAERLGHIAEAGIDGVLMNWADPVAGIEMFAADVIPLLERAGLRAAHRVLAA